MLKRIKLSINYKLINQECGFVPYIHIGYIGENNEELNEEMLNNLLITDYNLISLFKDFIRDYMSKNGNALDLTYNNVLNTANDDLVNNENDIYTEIHLAKNMECSSKLFIEDKTIVISKIFLDLFKLSRKPQIGFCIKQTINPKLLDFEIDGLNLDLISETSKCLEIIDVKINNNIKIQNNMPKGKKVLVRKKTK